jgi:plasmid stabilization system protein ParE
MEYRLSDGASADLREALDYYASRSDDLSERFLATVADATAEILQHPGRYPREERLRRKHEVRRFLLSDFPYSLIYEVQVDTVVVVAIAHHSRHPTYWTRWRG